MSSHNQSKVSDRLFWAKGDKDLYDKLEELESFFANKSRKEQFMYALAIGYYYRASKSLDNYDGMFNARDLTPIEHSILQSIAYEKTNDLSIVDDEARVFRIVEEYAHGGIILLEKELNKSQLGSYPKNIEVFLTDIAKSIKIE